MNPQQIDTLVRARRHAQARAQAAQDRREAIDDFWRGADAVWQRVQQDAAVRLHRSAQRWQSRLQRRMASHSACLTK